MRCTLYWLMHKLDRVMDYFFDDPLRILALCGIIIVVTILLFGQ